jgi:hypothetical protein
MQGGFFTSGFLPARSAPLGEEGSREGGKTGRREDGKSGRR